MSLYDGNSEAIVRFSNNASRVQDGSNGVYSMEVKAQADSGSRDYLRHAIVYTVNVYHGLCGISFLSVISPLQYSRLTEPPS